MIEETADDLILRENSGGCVVDWGKRSVSVYEEMTIQHYSECV